MWAEHDDAIRTMIRRATLVETEDGSGQQRMRLRGLASEEMRGVVRVLPHGFTSVPYAGSEGVLLALGGRSDRAMVLGVEDAGRRPTGLGEGSAAIYGPDGAILKIVPGPKITIDAKGGEVEIVNASKVTVEAANEIVMGVPGRWTRIRPHRIDLAVKTKTEQAPFKVSTQGGFSDVVWARID